MFICPCLSIYRNKIDIFLSLHLLTLFLTGLPEAGKRGCLPGGERNQSGGGTGGEQGDEFCISDANLGTAENASRDLD